MHWIYLIFAIIFEVLGTLSIKQTTITQSYYWGFAVKKIDIGTAYAIWAGLGTALITTLGWLIFKEYMNIQKVIAIFLIIIGSIMLKVQN